MQLILRYNIRYYIFKILHFRILTLIISFSQFSALLSVIHGLNLEEEHYYRYDNITLKQYLK